MNILHLDLGKEMRGGQHQVLLLMRALERRGHRQLLLARRDSPLVKTAGATPLGTRLPSGFDLIHAHDATAHTRALTSRLPLVISRRVAFPVKQGLLSHWKYARAAHYIAVSRFVAGELQRAGVPAAKITVIYDGVGLPELPSPQTGPFRAGFIAAAPEKPQHLFEEAAGNRGMILQPSRLPADLAKIDALVYLSNSEGLGSGILLAMAYGLPVIASNVGGIPEIVADGHTGLLVENNVAAIRAALDTLARDPARARSMGAAGRDWVASHATDAIMAERTEAVYRRVKGSS
jgi:glycosyltransferase involved in cell wall biosynthesis